ncbi:MAG: carbohydrate-binding protein [Bacteroidota bacterium]
MHTLTILAFDHSGLTTGVTKSFEYYRVFPVPGKIEAEQYSKMSGIETAPTTDTGGGLQVTSISSGDSFDYTVNVQEPGNYRVEFRISSGTGGGSFELRKMAIIPISSIQIETAGGDQNWITISDTINLSAGRQSLKVYAVEGAWNINWINFVKVNETSVFSPASAEYACLLTVVPNPVHEDFMVQYVLTELSPVEFILYDSSGKMIEKRRRETLGSPEGELHWAFGSYTGPGLYYLMMRQSGKKVASFKLLKQN